MEGVESENNAAADAERERRYREYMNESFNNFTMNNSCVGDLKSREENEFDEIHEFINEAGMNASISRIVDGSAVAWTMTIHFPRGTKIEMSNVIIKFPVDYPHSPPVLYCTDNIDHPFLGLRNFIPFKRLRNEYWASWIPISVVIAGVYELFKDHLRRKRPLEENINPHLIKISERAIDTYLRITKSKITRDTPSEEIPAALHIRTYFKLYEEQEELVQIDRKLSDRKKKLLKNVDESLRTVRHYQS